MNDLVAIMCPPLSSHSTPPEDQPGCQLFDCPACKNKMWLSKKKRGQLMFLSSLNKNIILRCYDCMTVYVEENAGKFADVQSINI